MAGERRGGLNVCAALQPTADCRVMIICSGGGGIDGAASAAAVKAAAVAKTSLNTAFFLGSTFSAGFACFPRRVHKSETISANAVQFRPEH